jgi:hypothetical protein
VDEVDDRLPDEAQRQELLDLIESHLLPADHAEANLGQTADEHPTNASGYAGYDDMVDEEEMMARAGQDQFFSEDKWGREGMEEVEGRDIDE